MASLPAASTHFDVPTAVRPYTINRVYSGTMKSNSSVFNANQGKTERFHDLARVELAGVRDKVNVTPTFFVAGKHMPDDVTPEQLTAALAAAVKG